MFTSANEPKHGLFRLYPTTYLPEQCVVDVVALHGLGGHAFNTWTDSDGHLWLRDSLPARIPHTRIMTFGYDSGVAFSRSRLTINDFALDLLERLRLARKLSAEQQRPLIFICHSLGGILFKEMLIQASLDAKNHGLIAQHVKGVVFLATPHRGSRSASQAQIVSKIVNTATFGTGARSDLLKTLQVSSPELETISRHAIQLLKAISIVSFYERKPLGFGVIVEPFSAILGLPNERAVPINADHRKIAKISPQMDRYIPIPEAVAELVEETQSNTNPLRNAENLEDLSEKLFCVDYISSQLRARQAHPGTCDWIFSDPAYLSWARSPQSDILMLTGGPGMGKSVLTRFILESVLSSAEETGFSAPYQGVRFFCSHLNSEHLETAQTTVLRSLLHQFVQLNPRCAIVVKNRLLDRKSGNLSYEMTLEKLWTAVREVLSLDLMKFTFIAIDALEELGTEAAVRIVSGLYNIISMLNRSSSGTQYIRILISSRHDPSVASAIPSLIFLRIPQHQVTRSIKIFLQDSVEQLAATTPGFNACTDAELRREIVQSISTRASGMFLWATVVWDDFTRVLLWNISAVRAKLAGIKKTPSRIGALYQQLFDKIDPDFKEDVFLILAIISVAGRALRVDEIAIVLSVAKTEHAIERSSDLDLIHALDTTMQEKFPDLVTFHDDHTVTLSHLSLGEYLNTLWVNEGGQTLRRAERVLARSCLKYLKLRDLIEDIDSRRTPMTDVETRYPFLEYGRTYLKHHLWKIPVNDPLWLLFADLAGPFGPCQLRLLGTNTSVLFGWRHWDQYPGISPLHKIVLEMPRTSDIEILIREFAAHGYDLDEMWQRPADRGASLSHCLWEMGSNLEARRDEYKGLVKLLFRLGASPDPAIGRYTSNLELVIQAKCWDILEMMMRHPKCNPTQQDARGRYIIHHLVHHGDADFLRKFLRDFNVDVNIQDKLGCTPLHLAAQWGNEAVVRVLLNVDGIRLHLTDQYGRTPLTVATYWGLQKVALCFLEHSHAFPTPQEGNMSALCFSAKHGHLEMCQRLLETCRYQNLERHLDESGKSICHHAAMNNWAHLLSLCLGANRGMANQIDHSGGTPLHVAARLGNTESCRVLIASGASLRLQDRLGRTPAQIAADAGFVDTLLVILERGRVDPNQWDHQGRNLVHWVASVDSTAVMRRVLDIPNVEIARRDRDGARPIDIAARCKCANVGKLLAEEMERRGLNAAWYSGFAWDMMYCSPEVDCEEEQLGHQDGARGFPDLYTQSRHKEWEELHRMYPEEEWGLMAPVYETPSAAPAGYRAS